MPIVVVETITRPEDAVEYMAQLIKESGLVNNVLKYDDELVGQYPAVQLLAMPYNKDVHGTHTFVVTIRVDIYVMHAKLTVNRATRHLEDLELATKLVTLIETNGDDTGLSLGGRLIAGWVETETPGIMPPKTQKGDYVVSTRLAWRGTTETRF